MSKQITVNQHVAKLLFNMKPESKKEEYAKNLSVAIMLQRRAEYDPSVITYMQEKGITKEDLKARVEYWEDKLRR